MSLKYGFYNSIDHDRTYDATDLSTIFDGIINDGVFQSIDSCLFTIAGTGMNVIVQPGRAWFNHTWTSLDTNLSITVPASNPAFNRCDYVILDVDKANRENSIKILQGTAGADPTPPELTSYQHPLALINVRAATTSIIDSDIQILVGTSQCPFVTGPLETAEIDDLFRAWNTQFTNWLSHLQHELDQDQIGHLQSQIDILGDNTFGRTFKKGDLLRSYDPTERDGWKCCNGQTITSDEVPNANAVTPQIDTYHPIPYTNLHHDMSYTHHGGCSLYHVYGPEEGFVVQNTWMNDYTGIMEHWYTKDFITYTYICYEGQNAVSPRKPIYAYSNKIVEVQTGAIYIYSLTSQSGSPISTIGIQYSTYTLTSLVEHDGHMCLFTFSFAYYSSNLAYLTGYDLDTETVFLRSYINGWLPLGSTTPYINRVPFYWDNSWWIAFYNPSTKYIFLHEFPEGNYTTSPYPRRISINTATTFGADRVSQWRYPVQVSGSVIRIPTDQGYVVYDTVTGTNELQIVGDTLTILPSASQQYDQTFTFTNFESMSCIISNLGPLAKCENYYRLYPDTHTVEHIIFCAPMAIPEGFTGQQLNFIPTESFPIAIHKGTNGQVFTFELSGDSYSLNAISDSIPGVRWYVKTT